MSFSAGPSPCSKCHIVSIIQKKLAAPEEVKSLDEWIVSTAGRLPAVHSLTSMSKPMFLLPSWWAAYSLEISSFPFTPEFSARARGKTSKASANFLMEYCSRPGQDCSRTHESSHVTMDQQRLVKLRPSGEAHSECARNEGTYLSVGGELFGQFNLSGSCSWYQSFVLQRREKK